MARIYPFKALLPDAKLASEIASVPYDVVNRREARNLANGNAHSFLHVTKPEIDLDDSVEEHDDTVYNQGASALQQFIQNGWLSRDEAPSFFAYRLKMNGHTQTGVVLGASVVDYEENIVRKHEFTRPDKENDRVKHMESLDAQSGTVLLCHKDHESITGILEKATAEAPLFTFSADDGIEHSLWRISAEEDLASLQNAFKDLGPIYIADGHHRSAAAARVAQARRQGSINPDHPWERFLAVSFPASEMRILPYNRVVKDLKGRSTSEFITAVGERFDVAEGKSEPLPPRSFNMYLDGGWHTLTAKSGSFDDADPVQRLDVSILQNQLLEPLLGIEDPRRDQRIGFVGGIRGDSELERRVNEGEAVAFALHPTRIEDLFAIADACEVMPPKSTWFEPKLRDGLVVHPLGD